MRYIITEDRINDLISKYLEDLDWWEWDIGDGEFNLMEGKYGKNKILYRIQNSSMVPDHEFEVIYISEKLINTISGLFLIHHLDSVKYIIFWFNMNYNKSLDMDNFEWMVDED